MGVDAADHPRLKELFEKFFSTQTPPEEVPQMMADLGTPVHEDRRRQAGEPGRRPDQRPDRGLRGRRPPHRRGDRQHAAADHRGRPRDHDQPGRQRRRGAPDPPRAAQRGAEPARCRWENGDRGDAALEHAHLARPDPLRDRGHRGRRQGPAEGRGADRLVRRARPRRAAVRADRGRVRHHPLPRTATSPSATARTSARAPRCPGWRRGSPCPRCTSASRTWTWRFRPAELRNKPIVTQNDLYELPVDLG